MIATANSESEDGSGIGVARKPWVVPLLSWYQPTTLTKPGEVKPPEEKLKIELGGSSGL